MQDHTPKWLNKLERKIAWLAVPNIAILLCTLQVAGFIFIAKDPAWHLRLALIPQLVKAGEIWRVITFIGIPLSQGFWFIFAVLFLWFIVSQIEKILGSFKTTFYILMSIILTVGFSLGFNFPVLSARHFEFSLMFALATLMPDTEILLLFFPVKLKWLGLFFGAIVFVDFIRVDWMTKIYILTIYSIGLSLP